MKWFTDKINTVEELRKQYKELLMKYHPDNNKKEDTTEIMKEINLEYNSLFQGLKNSTYKNEKENYKSADEETVKKILNELQKYSDIVIELCGSWIWVSGNTKPIKNLLKELGLKWASKKSMWYFGESKKKTHKSMDMEHIRTKYGSVAYKKEKEDVIKIS